MLIKLEEKMIKSKHMEYLQNNAKNNDSLDIENFIYKVKNIFIARHNRTKEYMPIRKNQFIGYWCGSGVWGACFRDINNNYFTVDPCVLAFKCEVFARIHDKLERVHFAQIIDQKLYQKVTDE